MGRHKQNIIVSRSDSPAPDHGARALEVLLNNKPVTKEGSPTLATLDDAKVRSSSDDSRAMPSIPIGPTPHDPRARRLEGDRVYDAVDVPLLQEIGFGLRPDRLKRPDEVHEGSR